MTMKTINSYFSNLKSNKKKIDIYFLDEIMIYLERDDEEIISQGEEKIPEGIFNNGVIINEEEFIVFLKDVFKDTVIKKINLILYEKIVLYRVLKVAEDIKEKEMYQYLDTALNNKIILPFKDPILDCRLVERAGEKELLFFAVSEKIINGYIRCFKKIKMKIVETDIPFLIFNRKVQEERTDLRIEEDGKYIMLVAVYRKLLSLTVWDKDYPVLNITMILKYEDDQSFIQEIQDQIYGIKNYFIRNFSIENDKLDKLVILPVTFDNKLNIKIEKVLKEENMTDIANVIFLKLKTERKIDALKHFLKDSTEIR